MIWRPIVSTGFSEVIGSWKIIAMSLPRILPHLVVVELEQVAPVEDDLALDDLARGLGIRRMSESALTLLPQPDSPTSPSVSPSST